AHEPECQDIIVLGSRGLKYPHWERRAEQCAEELTPRRGGQVLRDQAHASQAAEHAEPLNEVRPAFVPAEDRQMEYRELRPRRAVKLSDDVGGIKGDAPVLAPVVDAAQVVHHRVPLAGPSGQSAEARAE